jgi:putative salt-induced outer membrane protein
MNRRKLQPTTATVLMILCSFNALAESKRNYRGHVELGAFVTTGNTDAVSAKTAINVEQEFTEWRTEYVVDAQYQRSQFEDDEGEKQRETTEQQIFLSYQGNYKLEEPNKTFFMLGSYNDERFNGYNYQITAVTGYGWRLLEDKTNTVDIEIGPGYTWNEFDNGDKQQGTIFHGAFKYEKQLTVATRFKQDVTIDASFSGANSKTKLESSLIADINGRLAMKVSLFVEYNTKPDEDIRSVDTETGITLVYSF